MSSQTRDTHATSSGTGSDHEEDFVQVTALHGIGGSHAHQATTVAVSMSAESHLNLLKDVNTLRETSGQTQHALNEAQSRLATLEGEQAHL
uniref:Uncharacterized protein n=1 Tax=Peronospora matthiolae TaxID=2874970 RepID=A0AAV1UKE0_9STRA